MLVYLSVVQVNLYASCIIYTDWDENTEIGLNSSSANHVYLGGI